MPSDSISITTDTPNQSMVVETNQPSQWPSPTLASIKDKSMGKTNMTEQSVLINKKNVHSLKLTPTTLIDTTLQQLHNSSYTQ